MGGDEALNYENDPARDNAKKATGATFKATFKLSKILLKLLLPFAPYILLLLVIVVPLVLMVGAVNSSMPESKDLDYDSTHTEADEKRENEYMNLANEENVRETWEVSGEGDNSRDKNLGYLADEYGKDQKLTMEWGMIHSVSQLWVFINGYEDIPKEMPKKVARDLGPKFWYKTSTIKITRKNKDGTTSTSKRRIHLLVEAETYLGHYKYYYRWETKTSDTRTVTKEVLDHTETITLWDRLDRYLSTLYQIDEEVELTRLHVLETAKGYTREKEWLDYWLEGIVNFKGIGSSIPEDLRLIFEEAEKEYGIPAWLLAAIAYFESRFDPQALNQDSGAMGLMQIMPFNWPTYGNGGDPFDARDNVMAAARLLKQWGWGHMDPLKILAQYEGDPNSKEAQNKAQAVWKIALEYQQTWDMKGYVFPVKGKDYTDISSHFTLDRWGKPHYAVDIAAANGTPILAFVGGTIELAEDTGDGGNTIIMIGEDGRKYTYCHMSGYAVSPGARVNTGATIGYVGYTGHCKPPGPDGAHLHFAVKDLEGNPINPEPYLIEAVTVL